MNYTDVKRIRHNPAAEDVDNRELSELIDRAIDKQIPFEPFWEDGISLCPCCGAYALAALSEGHKLRGAPFCANCGQRLDWSDEE